MKHTRVNTTALTRNNINLTYWRKWRKEYVPKTFWNNTYYYSFMNYKEALKQAHRSEN